MAEQSKSGSRWRAEDAARELRTWAASGESAAEYARRRGLKTQRLLWWKKRLNSAVAQEHTTFVPAIIRATSAVATLHAGGEVVLEIADPAAVPPEWLAAFAVAVERASR